jgi:hypothetical protein
LGNWLIVCLVGLLGDSLSGCCLVG